MSKVIAHIEKIKRIHICSACSKQFKWSESAEWFGSFEEIEAKVCSQECKNKIIIKKKSKMKDKEIENASKKQYNN